jgi:SAM-dependent methyltransferase
MQLDRVVPFGRSLAEYTDMFSLTDTDLDRPLLDVGGGPASFSAELARRGGRPISIDPLYRLSGAVIRRRFDAVVDDIIAGVRATPGDWVWNWHTSPEALRRKRTRVLETFLADYPEGLREGRYVPGGLPRLPFTDANFELALCSHLLFLYASLFRGEFHYRAIREMLRVAREVRIFPLLTLELTRPACLGPVMAALRRDGCAVEIRPVAYELQRGGNEMLLVHRQGEIPRKHE